MLLGGRMLAAESSRGDTVDTLGLLDDLGPSIEMTSAPPSAQQPLGCSLDGCGVQRPSGGGAVAAAVMAPPTPNDDGDSLLIMLELQGDEPEIDSHEAWLADPFP
jgi:hypothetical protein